MSERMSNLECAKQTLPDYDEQFGTTVKIRSGSISEHRYRSIAAESLNKKDSDLLK